MVTNAQNSKSQKERVVSEVPFPHDISLTIGHEYVYTFEILILKPEVQL